MTEDCRTCVRDKKCEIKEFNKCLKFIGPVYTNWQEVENKDTRFCPRCEEMVNPKIHSCYGRKGIVEE